MLFVSTITVIDKAITSKCESFQTDTQVPAPFSIYQTHFWEQYQYLKLYFW